MKTLQLSAALLLAGLTHALAPVQDAAPAPSDETPRDALLDVTAASVQRLEDAQARLAAVEEQIASERLPINQRLRELEDEFGDVEAAYEDAVAAYDKIVFDRTQIDDRITAQEKSRDYLSSSLLGPYVREFESRLHVTEEPRYLESVEAAKDALLSDEMQDIDVLAAQVAVVMHSMDRLEELMNGTTFEVSVVDPDSLVQQGTALVVGPTALFLSSDGTQVGTVERFRNSNDASLLPFDEPLDAEAARALLTSGKGAWPLDPTLGNAQKIAATNETFLEHVAKGGAVMYPIGGMAALALLIGLYKWLTLSAVRKPSSKSINQLMESVRNRDEETAQQQARRLQGPVGYMLAAGVEAMNEPRELVEEIMYERVLRSKLRLQRMLPFIQICAASAPLLGLLGTVTGIINTFKKITVFGSGDVQSLSGGISEALITTKFGLVVAIPSLLLHAFLSRKARGVVGQMETAGVAFMNNLSKSPAGISGSASTTLVPAAAKPDPELVRAQVKEILKDILGPEAGARAAAEGSPASNA